MLVVYKYIMVLSGKSPSVIRQTQVKIDKHQYIIKYLFIMTTRYEKLASPSIIYDVREDYDSHIKIIDSI